MDTISGLGITMSVPVGWRDQSQLVLVAEQAEGFRPNLVIVREPAGDRSLEGFVAEHVLNLERTFSEFEVESVGRTTVGRRDGLLIEYTFEVPSATGAVIIYQQGQFMFAVRQYIYTATYSDAHDGFAISRSAAHRLIASITVDDE